MDASTSTRSSELEAAKQVIWRAIQALPGPDIAHSCIRHLSGDCLWVASHPVNTLVGPSAVADAFMSPLLEALPDIERRTDILFGGHWDGHIDGGAGCWVTCHGHYLGTMKSPLWGIPANSEPAFLRFGEFYRVVEGKIVEARILLDLPDLARQVGRPVLPKATGLEILVPGPKNSGGVRLGAAPSAETAASFELVMAMIGGLGRYDPGAAQDLSRMGMARYWRPDMMWYGPCGIGSSRSIAGFEQHHQRPFLTALPDRKGGHHRARFADGPYAASTGWPSVRATHAGPYLGVPATGKSIGLRVMDWWRVEDGLLAENWVMLDLPDLFMQVGVDILARAK